MNMNLTEIIFIIDRCGSIDGLESDSLGEFYTFIKNQKHIAGDTIVTTVLFDDNEILCSGTNIEETRLNNKEYFVRGSTALLEAVSKTIHDLGYRLSNTPEDRRPSKVIFVITTNSIENFIKDSTYKKVRELINLQQEKYNWEFIFLGANFDETKQANGIVISKNNTFDYESFNDGVEKAKKI